MITNKKIAITGDSSGIGKSISDYYKNTNDCIGFSLETHNLAIKETYDTAIDIIKDCDIFINNAYDRTYRMLQADLLYDVFKLWQHDPTKAILTIGSTAKYYNRPSLDWIQYQISKQAIETLVDKFQICNHKCGLIIVDPYFVRTRMYEKYLQENPSFIAKSVLETDEITTHINYLLELYFDHEINIYRSEIRKKCNY